MRTPHTWGELVLFFYHSSASIVATDTCWTYSRLESQHLKQMWRCGVESQLLWESYYHDDRSSRKRIRRVSCFWLDTCWAQSSDRIYTWRIPNILHDKPPEDIITLRPSLQQMSSCSDLWLAVSIMSKWPCNLLTSTIYVCEKLSQET